MCFERRNELKKIDFNEIKVNWKFEKRGKKMSTRYILKWHENHIISPCNCTVQSINWKQSARNYYQHITKVIIDLTHLLPMVFWPHVFSSIIQHVFGVFLWVCICVTSRNISSCTNSVKSIFDITTHHNKQNGCCSWFLFLFSESRCTTNISAYKHTHWLPRNI